MKMARWVLLLLLSCVAALSAEKRGVAGGDKRGWDEMKEDGELFPIFQRWVVACTVERCTAALSGPYIRASPPRFEGTAIHWVMRMGLRGGVVSLCDDDVNCKGTFFSHFAVCRQRAADSASSRWVSQPCTTGLELTATPSAHPSRVSKRWSRARSLVVLLGSSHCVTLSSTLTID